MDTPALAIAQSLWWRNRRSFIASATTLAVMAAVYPLLFAITRVEWVLAASTLPLVGVFAVVWNGLLFVEEPGNMSSHYPRYMLTLPVHTWTLVVWPIVFGSTTVALLWVVTAALVYNTSGFAVPVLLPALGCAAIMAWLQVWSWTPIANQWIRVFVTVLWMSVLAAFPIYLLTLPHRSSVWFASLLVTYLAAAFPLGLAAVAGHRRGDFWRVWPRRWRPRVMVAWPAHYRRRHAIGSPAAAQSWYEWNCHGLVIPAYVGSVLLLIWGILLVVRKQDSVMMAPIAGLLLGLPVALAGAAGPGLGRFKPIWIKDHVVMTFVAIRPLSSGQIVLAKFLMAARSALLTWVISLVLSLLWFLVSDNLDRAMKLIRDILDMYPGQRAIVVIALANVLLPALIWKHMTDGFAAALTGRPWIASIPAYVYIAGLVILVSVGLWAVNHPADLSWLFFVLSVFLLLGAVIKGALAIVAFRSVLHRRLMTWRAVTAALGLWLVLTGCGIGLAALLLPMPAPSTPVSWLVLALGIGLFVPLVRFPVATLALEWNRHR